MRSSRVLMIGMSGLAAEICKNLVLTGIGSLVLHDTATATATDLSAQFFLTAADIGSNRAEASVLRLAELNPMVKVEASSAPLSSLPPAFLSSFSAVIITEQPLSSRIAISRILRAAAAASPASLPTSLYTADLLGFHGVLLLDLIRHSYQTSKKPLKSSSASATDELQAEVTTLHQAVFAPYEAVVSMTEEEAGSQWGRRGMEKEAAVVYAAVQRVIREEGEQPAAAGTGKSGSAESVAALVSDLRRMRGLYVSAPSAIFGGLIAQEVLKVLSGKEEPHQNCIVLNADKGIALVKNLKPSVDA